MVLEIILNIIVIAVVLYHTFKLGKHMQKLDEHILMLEKEIEEEEDEI